MRLAAIFNLFDGCELLEGVLKCLNGHVDVYIFLYQKVSNFGEHYNPIFEISEAWRSVKQKKSIQVIWEYLPAEFGGFSNEIKKRNIGIDIARDHGCTNFLHVDCDEYYEDFAALKKEYIDSGYAGSVCPIYTYFKKPTWRLENLDGYFVPFIHELHSDTKAGRSSYPFYCDPTRVINQPNVIKLSQPMHHFSWVRNDIERKARNSSAGQSGNKLKGLLDDYHSPELEAHPDGYIIKDMGGQKIKIVPDLFGIFSPKTGQKADN